MNRATLSLLTLLALSAAPAEEGGQRAQDARLPVDKCAVAVEGEGADNPEVDPSSHSMPSLVR